MVLWTIVCERTFQASAISMSVRRVLKWWHEPSKNTIIGRNSHSCRSN